MKILNDKLLSTGKPNFFVQPIFFVAVHFYTRHKIGSSLGLNVTDGETGSMKGVGMGKNLTFYLKMIQPPTANNKIKCKPPLDYCK